MGQTLSAVTRIGATLSSTALTASNCIDNDINSVCSSTTSVDTPWLSVQLPLGATVGYVVFYHRPDCESLGGCSQFATPAQIWVSNALGALRLGRVSRYQCHRYGRKICWPNQRRLLP